jgi:hypothetical protein
LLDDFKVQCNLINGLEVGVSAFHYLIADGLMESGDEHLGLKELPSVDQRVVIDLFAGSICLGGLGHLIGLAGHESFQWLDVPGKVGKTTSPGFCTRSWRLAQMVLAEYLCSKVQRKLALTAFQLALSVPEVSKLSRQDLACPRRIQANSWTCCQPSQVAMLAATSTCSMSHHPVVVSLVLSV